MNSVLSAREKEVLQLLVEGNTHKEIAELLFLSSHTVVSHVKNMMTKLNAKNCVQLVYKASKLGYC